MFSFLFNTSILFHIYYKKKYYKRYIDYYCKMNYKLKNGETL